ncbi:MAG: hypothetical protein AAF927_01890 [Bacteroidota bacterium]
MRIPFIAPLLLLLVIVFGGCCEECQRESLGSFEFTPIEEAWIEFAETKERTFRNTTTGSQVLFKYEDIVASFETQLFECDDFGRCGLCCTTFDNPFRFVQLRSSDGQYVFDITLRKDFQNFAPTDDPNKIESYLSITFNNFLTCQLFSLPDTVLTEDINLGGKDFFNVSMCDFSTGNSFNVPGEPIRFYFNKLNGIIGFEVIGENENEIWILV